MDINKIVAFLKGKKRYIVAAALGVIVILKALGYSIPSEVYSIFGLQDVQVTPIVEVVEPVQAQ